MPMSMRLKWHQIRQKIMDKLNKIISSVFEIKEDEIKDNFGPGDIAEWDSLSQFVLISEIETHYKITLDIEEIFRIMTIGDIRSVLKEKIDKKTD